MKGNPGICGGKNVKIVRIKVGLYEREREHVNNVVDGLIKIECNGNLHESICEFNLLYP